MHFGPHMYKLDPVHMSVLLPGRFAYVAKVSDSHGSPVSRNGGLPRRSLCNRMLHVRLKLLQVHFQEQFETSICLKQVTSLTSRSS